MTKSDSESSALELSSSESHFVPREGDSEDLWEVLEITDEKGKKYRVKWAGVDPKTNKPWEESWVPKHDVTDDLVVLWKKKKAAKKKEEERRKSTKRNSTGSKRGRPSTVSRVSTGTTRSKDSASTATTTARHSSITTVQSRTKVSTTPMAKKIKVESNTKKRPVRPSMDTPSSVRPLKKRRVEVSSSEEEDKETEREEESYPVRKMSSKVLEPEVDDEDEEEEDTEYERGMVSRSVRQSGRMKTKARARSPSSESGTDYSDLPKPPPKPKEPIRKRSSKATSSKASLNGQPLVKEETPVLESKATSSKTSKAESSRASPTKEKRVIAQIDISELDADNGEGVGSRNVRRSPNLSPWTLNRLAEFDTAIGYQVGKEDTLFLEPPEIVPEDDLYPPSRADAKSLQKEPLFLPESSDQSEVPELPYPASEARSSKARSISAHGSKLVVHRSYEHEVIPETESSMFNTQSQDKERAVPVTSAKSPLRSRMKPKVPGSANGSKLSILDDAYDLPVLNGSRAPSEKSMDGREPPAQKTKPGKPLKPIPTISPSKFVPHLPSSAIETAQDPPSSLETIECFDSPDRPQRAEVPSRTEDIDETSTQLSRRGAELAEAAVERRRQERGQEKSKKMQLRYTSKQREDRRKEKLNILSTGVRDAEETDDDEEQHVRESGQQEDVHQHDIQMHSRDDTHKSSSPVEENVDSSVQELEDAFVDLNGGMMHSDEEIIVPDESMYMQEILRLELGEPAMPGQELQDDMTAPDESMHTQGALRQEEEESTQDIMQELEEHRRLSEIATVAEGAGQTLLKSQLPQPTPASGYMGDTSGRTADESVTQPSIPSQDIIPTSTPPLPSLGHMPKSPQMSPARSASHTAPQPGATEPSNAPVKPAEDSRPHSPESYTLLSNQLAAEQHKNQTLAMELDTLRKALGLSHQARSTAEEELQMQREASRNLLQSEKAKWEAEIASLNNALETANRDKQYAETDCRSIREAYTRADSFATSLRKENAELEERAAVAENQAKVGVAAIKATFELRMKQLEDDARMWKKMSNFLMEKDIRTNNDEIRRRAAEHPQLELQVKDLVERLSSAVNNIHGLAKQISDKEYMIRQVEAERDKWRNDIENSPISDIEAERDKWKWEAEKLGEELNDARTKLRDLEGRSSDDDSLVFFCRWLLEDNAECGATFSSRQELQDHMFTAQHLSLSG